MSDSVTRDELFGTRIGSPARAEAVAREARMRELEAKFSDASSSEIGEEDTSEQEQVDDHEPEREQVVVSSQPITRTPVATLPAGSEQIVVKNKKVPVSMAVKAGKNALTQTDTSFVLSFDAYDVQVNDDYISVMYRGPFSVSPPSFTPMTLTVKGAKYNVMCINTTKKFDTFDDMSFMIANV